MEVKALRIEISGSDELARKLMEKSQTDFDEIAQKNARDIFTRSQQPGGTPVDTAQLRLSMRYQGDQTGYGVHYAPHVEYGHRLVRAGRTVGYVPGQYYLKRNVDTQRPIYKQDLLNKIRE